MASPTEGYSAKESFTGGAAVAAPGAGATVCQILIPATTGPGIYKIEINFFVTGTTEVALNNAVLSYGATVSSIPTVTGQAFDFVIERAYIQAAPSFVKVAASAAATAGSVYSAYICVTKIG